MDKNWVEGEKVLRQALALSQIVHGTEHKETATGNLMQLLSVEANKRHIRSVFCYSFRITRSLC